MNTYFYAMPKLRMPGAVPPLHAHSYRNTDIERTRIYLRLRNLQGIPSQFLFLN